MVVYLGAPPEPGRRPGRRPGNVEIEPPGFEITGNKEPPDPELPSEGLLETGFVGPVGLVTTLIGLVGLVITLIGLVITLMGLLGLVITLIGLLGPVITPGILEIVPGKFEIGSVEIVPGLPMGIEPEAPSGNFGSEGINPGIFEMGRDPEPPPIKPGSEGINPGILEMGSEGT